MKRVVGYIRTIDDDKHIDGQGSQAFQHGRIKAVALNNGWDLERVFMDEKTSHDTPILKRRAFNEMIRYMMENDIDTIVVESGGRIARSFRSLLFFSRDFLQNEGINVLAADMPMLFHSDKENITAEFVSNILFALIEYQESDGLNIRHWVK